MMDGMWQPPPAHQRHEVPAPVRPPPDRLRDAFFADVRRLTFGLVRGERWRLRLGPLTLLAFGEPAFDGSGWTWPITGGLLARRPGGTLRYEWRDGLLVGTVDGYLPRLPRGVYELTQVRVHRWLTRRFLRGLRDRPRPAGVLARLAAPFRRTR